MDAHLKQPVASLWNVEYLRAIRRTMNSITREAAKTPAPSREYKQNHPVVHAHGRMA